VTEFHLLRHGEHRLQGRIVAGRMPGIGLSETGRKEVAAAAERLAGAGITAIYSSPLDRGRETAEIVALRLGLPVVVRDELSELDFGEWTGSTFDDVRVHAHWPAWSTLRSIATIPGGEAMRHVQHRIVDTLIDLHRTHPDAGLVVVSHGDVIRAALAFALGMPLDLFTRIEVATASISTVRIDPAGIRVICINERVRN
jgi:probable phosphoglycerate mutase